MFQMLMTVALVYFSPFSGLPPMGMFGEEDGVVEDRQRPRAEPQLPPVQVSGQPRFTQQTCFHDTAPKSGLCGPLVSPFWVPGSLSTPCGSLPVDMAPTIPPNRRWRLFAPHWSLGYGVTGFDQQDVAEVTPSRFQSWASRGVETSALTVSGPGRCWRRDEA